MERGVGVGCEEAKAEQSGGGRKVCQMAELGAESGCEVYNIKTK